MQGRHMFVLLHDHNATDVPGKSVLAAPITRIKSHLRPERIKESYLKINKNDYSFLSEDSFVSTH